MTKASCYPTSRLFLRPFPMLLGPQLLGLVRAERAKGTARLALSSWPSNDPELLEPYLTEGHTARRFCGNGLMSLTTEI